MTAKDGKSSWSSGVSGVSLEKRELFEERAETILLIIKHRFPGIPQSALDISKIQYNRVRNSTLNMFHVVLILIIGKGSWLLIISGSRQIHFA